MDLSKMGISAVAAFALSAAFCEPSDPQAAAAGWTPPEAWRFPLVAGREFVPYASGFDSARFAPEVWPESFLAMATETRMSPRKVGPGVWRWPLDEFTPAKDAEGRSRPFILNYYPRANVRGRVFLTDKVEVDAAAYAKWRAEHPEFLGFQVTEWVNDANWVTWKTTMKSLTTGMRRPELRMTTNEVEAVLNSPPYVAMREAPKAGDRRRYVNEYLKGEFDRVVEIYYGDVEKLVVLEGLACCDHLVADWGAGMLEIETSRNHNFWQIQMMFCRGAARQFRRPWMWFIASFFQGYDSKGKLTNKGNLSAKTPDKGISTSAVKRATYLTYLAGASGYRREGGIETVYFIDEGGKRRLSPEGELYDEFWKYTRRNPRGIPYQPVAILSSVYRGYYRSGGSAWWAFPKTKADEELDVVMDVILERKRNITEPMKRRGVERVMANSKYGDVFDVLAPDCRRTEFFRRAIGNYAWAVVTGDYERSGEMERALADYVANGGRLVLNTTHLTDGLAWAKGGEAVRRGASGAAVCARKPVGRGEVFLFEGHYTAEDLAWLMDVVVSSSLPAKVVGDVQYGFGRLPDGWQLYLVNNGGVTKFADKAAVYDPKGAEVEVLLGGLPRGHVRELVAGRPFTVEGGKLRIEVPSGDLAVLEFKE